MAEVPAEQSGESVDTQKVLLTPFLTKTYQMVDDPAVDDMISWNEDGTGFIIWRPAEFARDLLPKYFKHNNLSSFVRQLNTYGFRKVVPDRWEFANDFFKKGEKGLLGDIQRRKMTQLGSVATAVPAAAEGPSTVQVTQSSPPKSIDEQQMGLSSLLGGTKLSQAADSTMHARVKENEGGNNEGSKSTSPELRKENQRLAKENQQMTDELTHLKGLCNNIFSIMSNYGTSGQGQQDAGNISMESKQLDLLQSSRYLEGQGGSNRGTMDEKEEEGDNSPKLFGVSIGAKRRKGIEDDQSSHRHQQDEAHTDNNSYSNTAQSEMKQEGVHHSSTKPNK